MNRLEGCRIESLDNEACRAILGWSTGSDKPEPGDSTVSWLLAHCHDGVTWGWFDHGNRLWRLSSEVFPDLSPKISGSNFLDARLFGSESETLIWRTDVGLSGRCLIDEPPAIPDSPTRTDDEIRILLGDRASGAPKDGFTRVGTAGGAEQAVPLECTDGDFKSNRWPLRLRVRHYFEQDMETGAVRVAAARLVDVFKEVL